MYMVTGLFTRQYKQVNILDLEVRAPYAYKCNSPYTEKATKSLQSSE